MSRSQETFNKREVRNKKEKKRKKKEEKRAKRREEGTKDSFDDMIAYVDEFGMITSSPPDPDNKTDIKAEDIELDMTREDSDKDPAYIRKGVITFLNESKGYGFIRDNESKQSIFVHVKNLLEPVKQNDTVVFELGRGPKGPSAMKVKLDTPTP